MTVLGSVLMGAQSLALLLGALAAGAALYGRYRTLPAFLTGPAVCRMEAGGCQVLFRTPTSSLLGVPNAALGLVLYVGIAVGRGLGLAPGWLLLAVSAAIPMSAYLAWYLLKHGLECRICWTGHLSNALLWLSLAGQLVASMSHPQPG